MPVPPDDQPEGNDTMTTRGRLVTTLDAFNLECDGDHTAMQAMLTAELARNPCGDFASALKLLDIAPTIEALEAARDALVPPFKPHIVP